MTNAQTPAALTEAANLIEQGKYADALELLQTYVAGNDDGQAHSMLGVAHFHLEQYEQAAQAFEAALSHSADNQDWAQMRDFSRNNATAEVSTFVPEKYYFDRDVLLAEPQVPAGALPMPPPPVPRPGLIGRIIRDTPGVVATIVMDLLIQGVGRTMGYRDAVWTNWYRRKYLVAILTLGYMREKLDKNNLKTTYPEGALVAYQRSGQVPPEGVVHFRTADGSWNNLDNPKEGAAGTRFPRNVNNTAIKPETGERLMTPNPRTISRKLLARDANAESKEVPFLNLLAASWINFQNHDWVHHGEVLFQDTHEIPLDEDDPARRKYMQTKIVVPKTQSDPTYKQDGEETPITFINEVTHWWDGSQIYGNNQEAVNRVRSGIDGKVKLTADGLLPLDNQGIEVTGFTRNWWVGLAMLHTLFAREHNSICDRLKETYPDWDDTRLFNVARLINAAVMAKIHSVEWTPAILPYRPLDAGLKANWYGLLTNMFRSGGNKKTLADMNVRNPEMGGVVGNPINKHGEPYGLTEEFVEVYRLHSLLPEFIQVMRVGGGDEKEDVPFVETRQAGSGKLTGRVPVADLFYSFGNQHPGLLVLNNFPTFMRELSVPGNPLFDMAAVDILRARERGIPRYNEFRRQLGLKPIRSFEDLVDCEGDGCASDVHQTHAKELATLKEVYGSQPRHVEDLDLLVGTLGEVRRPTNFGFGETLFQIFILNATRRLQADRFFTDSYNSETYTQEGLDWIDRADFKTVLLRNFPELGRTGLANVKNAFEPWDTDEVLSEARHPLRGFDRELKPNPWQGDTWREVYAGGSQQAEEAMINSFVEDIKQVQLANQKKGKSSQIRRAFHAKVITGVTNAEFRISPDIPAELQLGIFQPGAVHRAAVRLSNAAGTVQADTEKDLRGLAVRVYGGDATHQDFLTTNADPNHARDAEQFMKIATATAKASGRLGSAARLLFALGPFEGIRVMRTVSGQMKRQVQSLATESYFSRAPIKFGDFAVKYSLQPALDVGETLRSSGVDYLRDEMTARLAEGPVTFQFVIQRYVDERRTPIEDGSVKWEADTEVIAELVIPQQDLTTAEAGAMKDEINGMAFNPWNTTDEFRPLGSLNRARKAVYESSAGFRSG